MNSELQYSHHDNHITGWPATKSVQDLFIGQLWSNREVFKVVVKELKSGSFIRISVPTLKHQSIDGVWQEMRVWFGHAIPSLYLLYHITAVHAYKHNWNIWINKAMIEDLTSLLKYNILNLMNNILMCW